MSLLSLHNSLGAQKIAKDGTGEIYQPQYTVNLTFQNEDIARERKNETNSPFNLPIRGPEASIFVGELCFMKIWDSGRSIRQPHYIPVFSAFNMLNPNTAIRFAGVCAASNIISEQSNGKLVRGTDNILTLTIRGTTNVCNNSENQFTPGQWVAWKPPGKQFPYAITHQTAGKYVAELEVCESPWNMNRTFDEHLEYNDSKEVVLKAAQFAANQLLAQAIDVTAEDLFKQTDDDGNFVSVSDNITSLFDEQKTKRLNTLRTLCQQQNYPTLTESTSGTSTAAAMGTWLLQSLMMKGQHTRVIGHVLTGGDPGGWMQLEITRPCW